ncbi:MAG: FAD-dependent oxidoreductase [Anaerovoracaceae bacterium]
MGKIIIIGGGWAGCSAAITGRKSGAEVLILERTDLLLGLGNVGGIMRNNGRFTATEENIAMGAGELFDITDKCATHKDVEFPGHNHASFYDVLKVEPEVGRLLKEKQIHCRFQSRVVDVLKKDDDSAVIKAVALSDGEVLEGDVFIDCTGTTGPMGNCAEYGNGCSMCILRCPAFGPRVSVSQRAGGEDFCGVRNNGQWGAFSGSCKLEKSTLSKDIQNQLTANGVAIIPLPEKLINRGKLDMKVCKQYALEPFAENIILIDTGFAKMMTPFFPLEQLRQVAGFENVRYADPYAGGKGNSIRYMAVTRRSNTMRVDHVKNLFCGGEKAGLFVGHTEAISTGALAGHNAGRMLNGRRLLELPKETAIGSIIAFNNEKIENEEGLKSRFTFAGDEFFEYMKGNNLYSTDKKIIANRIKDCGLDNIYDKI